MKKEKKQNDWRTGVSIPVPYRCERYALPIELVPHLTFFFPFPFLAFFSSFPSSLLLTLPLIHPFFFTLFFFHSLSFLCLFVYLFVNKSDSNVSTSLPSKFPSSFFLFFWFYVHIKAFKAPKAIPRTASGVCLLAFIWQLSVILATWLVYLFVDPSFISCLFFVVCG